MIITGRFDLKEAAAAAGVRAVVEKPVYVDSLMRMAGELFAKGVESGGEHGLYANPGLLHVPGDAGAFRRAIEQRAMAPFAAARQSRHWGINE